MQRPNLSTRTVQPRSSGFTLLELVVVVLILLFIIGMLLPHGHSHDREKARRVNCAGNLKQIGLGMLMYTGDSGGYFPIHGEPGTPYFEPLNSLDTLASGKVYSCPSASTSRTTASLSNYIYVGSGLMDDNTLATQIRIAFDASGNHPKNQWMNALFMDGHVKGARPDAVKGWNTHANDRSPNPAGLIPPPISPTERNASPCTRPTSKRDAVIRDLFSSP